MTRIGRGQYGFLNLNEDLYDDTLVIVKVQRLETGVVLKTPHIDTNKTLSYALNYRYRTLLMPSITKCCANCPYFEDTYEMPLKMNDFALVNCVLEPSPVVPVQTCVLTANMTARCNLSASMDINVQTERID